MEADLGNASFRLSRLCYRPKWLRAHWAEVVNYSTVLKHRSERANAAR
jgi:hypothetical protein